MSPTKTIFIVLCSAAVVLGTFLVFFSLDDDEEVLHVPQAKVEEASEKMGVEGEAPKPSDFPKQEPGDSVNLAREALAENAGPNSKRYAVEPIFRRLVTIETKEAISLVLSFMEKPDHEFDFSHKGYVFFKLLKDVPSRFAAMIEEAALLKVRAQIAEGKISLYGVQGYIKIAGKFAGSEGIEYLKKVYEGECGTSPQMIGAAFHGLCLTGETGLIDYFIDEAGIRSPGDAKLILHLGKTRVVKKLKGILLSSKPDSLNPTYIKLIARSGLHAEAIGLFETLSTDPNPHKRVLAMTGISSFRPKAGKINAAQKRRIIDMVVRSMEDHSKHVRRAAYYAIEYNKLARCESVLVSLKAKSETETDPNLISGIEDAIREMERD